MILNNDCAMDYGLVNETDFTHPMHKEIYRGIASLVVKNKPVDYLGIYEETNHKTDIKYMAKLITTVPSTAAFEYYVENLKDATLKREMATLADKLRNTELSGKESVELAEKEIFNLREKNDTSKFTHVGDIVPGTYQEIWDIYEGKKERGLPTGFTALDNIIGGMRKSEYILLAARPSIGKTALAINIAQDLIMRNQSVAFFSLEMNREQLTERLLRGMSLIESDKLAKKNGKKMTQKDWDKLLNTANYIFRKNLYIDDNPSISVAEMQSMSRRLKRTKGLDLVIIDYLQLIQSNIKGSRREQVEQVSRDLKRMAKELNVPVLVISSLSRANMQRESKIPVLSDLRETGQIEFDADVVMFVHREYYYKPSETELKHDADIIIAKNRNGEIGRAKLNWYAEYTRFMSKGEIIDG
jgi:replicative DNA helicase